MNRRVVVIGLDGATLDLIKPLAKVGKLRNLARVMRNGAYGELKSTVHPITPQAWSTFLTGKNAGKHGIFDFTTRKKDSYKIQFINASMRKTETIFSLLSKANKRVGAIAIPFTFPPEKVNGFMLSGMDAPAEDERSVYPGSIYAEIKSKFGNYYIHLASPVGRKIDDDKFWRDIKKEDENRTLVSRYLMKKYPCDLFMTVYNNTDRVAHQYLNENLSDIIQNNSAAMDEDLLVKTYENTDAQVGSLLSEIDDSTTVIIMSDHGVGPIRRIFFLNRWLEENGFLTYRSSKDNQLIKIVRLSRLLAKRYFPRKAKNVMKSRMAALRDKVDSFLSLSEIEWEQTQAYGFGMFGNININLKGREPKGIVDPGKDYEDLRNCITEKLSQLRDPDTGDKIIEKVYKREELYEGPCLQNAPDLLIGWKDYAYYTSVSLGKEKGAIFGPHLSIDCSEYKHMGTHRLNGIFMAMGSVIKKGEQISGAQIHDLAPTILYLLGQSIPDDMDGKILSEIFVEEFLKENPPAYDRSRYGITDSETVTYSDEEEEKIAERLRTLGYLE